MTAHREHAGTRVSVRPPNRRAERLAWKDKAQARAKLVVMLVVSVALLGAGCGSGSRENAGSGAPHQATSTTRLLEAAPAPDPVTPDGVAVAALKEIYTWYPERESQGASLARARKWLGPSLARVVDSAPSNVETPKATVRWADWAKAKARVEAFTFASGERPPTNPDPNTQQFKIGIEQTVVYPDGRKEQLAPMTVIATVVRTPGGWRLDAYR
ncbi:hypothetical protein [Nocardia arthritidis]|uniref:Uncharacterized protein n=1 Tax=Nocardia arthritidis TaxID=228602 RepID=A0A6G9YJV8_9NOCA|nr:hypothetical protein [Nocardia arthritidis]QIS13492.1 hypothetical protein F5544_28195 [Nocardia arthritidis]